jgi:uncharacterized protein YxeA
MKSPQLKIKILSLAEEAKIIRNEENRFLSFSKNAAKSEHKSEHLATYRDLKAHRKGIVGKESRDALLAYGFLRGRAYIRMETKRFSDPNWGNIERMILKYGKEGSQKLKQRFEQWKQEAGKCQSS